MTDTAMLREHRRHCRCVVYGSSITLRLRERAPHQRSLRLRAALLLLLVAGLGVGMFVVAVVLNALDQVAS